MITRRILCSIALAGLFPASVIHSAEAKPRIAVVYVSRTGTPGALLKPSAA